LCNPSGPMRVASFLVLSVCAAYSPDVVSDEEEAAAVAEPRPAWLEYWVPTEVPAEYGEFAKLTEANSTCVLLPNTTQGSLWGEGVYDGNGSLVNGTLCALDAPHRIARRAGVRAAQKMIGSAIVEAATYPGGDTAVLTAPPAHRRAVLPAARPRGTADDLRCVACDAVLVGTRP